MRTLLAAALTLAAALAAAPALAGTTPVTPVTPPPSPVIPPVPAPIAPPAAAAPPFGTSAVVLVGGFNSSSPFTTPACAATDRGPTWGAATGPAAALSAAGFEVFTAPIANAGDKAAPSCLGGQSTPDIPQDGSVTIDSNGAMPANQQALVAFLRFLNTSYGITTVQLVGHSDGGLWSRAAITQLRSAGSPVTVTNLTTIGTPHLGSFGADLAMALNGGGGSCSTLSGAEKVVCQLFYASIAGLIQDLGPDVIEELSSGWLAQWNPGTSIGCPVTVLAGDHVGWNLGLGYYTPNDGIVGQASALNQATLIPALAAAPFTPRDPPGYDPPTFDVVHSESLEFLSPHTELNTEAVSDAVVASVQSPPATACAAAGQARAATAQKIVPATPLTIVLPMRRALATRHGRLKAPDAGDAILLARGASVRCRGRKLATAPLLGSAKVRVVVARCARPVRVHGRALQLDRVRATVRMQRHGRTLHWWVAGEQLRHVRAQLRVDGRWRPVHGARLRVPRRRAEPALRVRGIDATGRAVRAFTRLVR